MTLALSSVSIVVVMLAVTEFLEYRYFTQAMATPGERHFFFVARGVVLSFVLACWAAIYVLRHEQAQREELRLSREHYRSLLNASPNAVILCDERLQVRECNLSAERLYGITAQEVAGLYLPTVPSELVAEMETLARQVRAGKPVLNVETKRHAANGTVQDVQLSLLPFRERGENYLLEVTTDIRERVRMRASLLHLEKLTSMGKMAAGTAHHLNTPLSSMLLRLRMMRAGEYEDSLDEDLHRVEESVRFCQRFVRRMLEFARPSQSPKQPEPIGSTVEAVANLLRPQLTAKRVHLNVELGAVAEERILGNRDQLEVVFLSLLSNALDAINPGGNIEVRGGFAGVGRAAIEIRDDGSGMQEAVLSRIFEPFFTTKPLGKGTGLGLATSKNIIEDHRGTIRVASKLGVGTTTVIEMPVHQDGARAEGAIA